jgi:hypothetical protein
VAGVVAPSPRTRRPAPRPQPRPLPPSARRRPPPYAYGPPRRHGGRRLVVLVLVLATLAVAGYLYLARGGSSANATGFLGADQQSVKAADTVIAAAGSVQRFTELGAFNRVATEQIHTLFVQRATLQSIEAGASGRQKQIANEAVSAVQQAIVGADRYRLSVALTYRLNDADAAHQDLSNAIASLHQQAQAWQHS